MPAKNDNKTNVVEKIRHAEYYDFQFKTEKAIMKYLAIAKLK